MQEYYLKSGLLDRPRKLVIGKDYVEFEKGDLKGNEFTRFECGDIIDFKHEADWIVWYKFSVGKIYSITFKNKEHHELRVTFRNYFGQHKGYPEIYSEIINAAWDCFNSRIVSEYLQKIEGAETFSLQGIAVNYHGLTLRNGNGLIFWSDVEVKDYHTYYVIFKRGISSVHSRISFNEYESEILWSVVKAMKTARNN